MISATLLGAVMLVVPLVILAWLFLRRRRAVYLFSVVLILVGTGYLMATGATEEIGKLVLGGDKDVTAPAETAPATQASPAAPATETAPTVPATETAPTAPATETAPATPAPATGN